MKKITKIFIVSVLVLTLGMVNIAASSEMTAVISDIKLFLNGQSIDKEIIIIDGTSYLPVRAISEALDLTVEWDGDTRTISLNDTNNLEIEGDLFPLTVNGGKTSLEEVSSFAYLNPTSNSHYSTVYINEWMNGNAFEVDGKSYDIGYGIDDLEYGSTIFTIDNSDLRYTNFTCYFAIDSFLTKNKSITDYTFLVYDSNEYPNMIFEQMVSVEDGLVKCDIDITGYSTLDISVRATDEGYKIADYPVILEPRVK